MAKLDNSQRTVGRVIVGVGQVVLCSGWTRPAAIGGRVPGVGRDGVLERLSGSRIARTPDLRDPGAPALGAGPG